MATTDPLNLDEEFDVGAYVAEKRAKWADMDATTDSLQVFAPGPAPAPSTSNLKQFSVNLPRNVGVGLLDAALNAADLLDVGEPDPGKPNATDAVVPFAETRHSPDVIQARAAVQGFRDYLAANSDTADEITQGVAGFAIPYTGFMKAFGVARNAGWVKNVIGLAAADVATATTVLPPHAGRMADLVELGKHAEGKLGEVFNTITPDGSLQNKYIDWVTARDGVTEFGGRFRNAVDTLVGSVAAAGLLTTAAGTFRAARYAAENIGTGPMPGSRAAQAGKIDLTAPETRPRGNLVAERTGSMLDDEFVLPDSQVIRAQDAGKDVGFISFKENDAGALQINRTKVDESLRGQGTGKKLLLSALDAAEAQGKPLVSDTSVTAAQLRVYDSLQKSGQIKVEYSNPEGVKAALAGKDVRTVVFGAGGKSVVTKIERIKGAP